MKVLWFSNSPAAAYYGQSKGTGSWMEALDYAVQRKVELHISYLYPYKQEPFKNGFTTYHPIYTGNIIVESLKNRFLSRRQPDYLQNYLNVINDVKPDIIHIHGSENSFHEIVRRTDIPMVLSIQGNLSVYSYKYLSGFHGKLLSLKKGSLNLKSLIFGRNSFLKDYEYMNRMAFIEQKNLINIKNVIGRTDWDYRITRILAPHSKYYIGNEILRNSFYTGSWKNQDLTGKISIFTTNGDNYYKGFETLCYALHLLLQLGIEVEWRVAGIIETSAVNKIAKRVLKDKYPYKGLVLLGSLDENGLVQSLQFSNIYVMPSHIENSPNNLCEAMIIGLPCIATHAGGTASILKDKEEGLIIQSGDPWAMAGAIVEFINNPEQAKEYANKARIAALKRHNRDNIVSELINTYQEIINSK